MPKKIDRNKIRRILPKYIDILPDREKEVVRMYYGIDGEEKLSYRQIGKQLGVSGERIRQIEYRAIERIWNKYLEDESKPKEIEEARIENIETETTGAIKMLNHLAQRVVKDVTINRQASRILLTFDDGGSLSFRIDKKMLDKITVEKKKSSGWVGGHSM